MQNGFLKHFRMWSITNIFDIPEKTRNMDLQDEIKKVGKYDKKWIHIKMMENTIFSVTHCRARGQKVEMKKSIEKLLHNQNQENETNSPVEKFRE